MKASSLRRHLADMHTVYQQTVVAEEMLECRPTETHIVSKWSHAGLSCPFSECGGLLSSGWLMRQHFQDVHPMNLVKVPKEGKFDRCGRCGMQVDPRYPHHRFTKECQVGVERKKQREAGVTSALALRQQFSAHWDCWSEWRYSNTWDACLCRLTITSGRSAPSCGKPEPLGLVSGRCSGQRMSPLASRQSSTKWWFRPCYSTAAKCGSSRRPLCQVSRGSTSVQPTGLWRDISHGGDQDTDGFTRS